jgi:hypothetical protein
VTTGDGTLRPGSKGKRRGMERNEYNNVALVDCAEPVRFSYPNFQQ